MTALISKHHDGDRPTRRTILIGATATLFWAPAIVQTASLMPARSLTIPLGPPLPVEPPYAGFCERLRYDLLEKALRCGIRCNADTDSSARRTAIR